MSDDKAEPDVDADPARVDSRDVGGREEKRTGDAGGGAEGGAADEGSTTGGTPDGSYVGRVAGQDPGYEEETGAERRAQD